MFVLEFDPACNCTNLAGHATIVTDLQNFSPLGEGTSDSNKTKNRSDNRRSQKAAVMFLDTERTLIPLIYCTTDKQTTTPMIMMPHGRHHEGFRSRILCSKYATRASDAYIIDY